MSSSIIERNLAELSSAMAANISYTDLSYKPLGKDGIALSLEKPILNAYKLWLQSGKRDYIREPNKGGIFSNMLREYPFDPSSEPLVETLIRQTTETEYPSIKLLDVKVKCNRKERKWEIAVVVSDKLTGLVSFEDMANMNFSIDAIEHY